MELKDNGDQVVPNHIQPNRFGLNLHYLSTYGVAMNWLFMNNLLVN